MDQIDWGIVLPIIIINYLLVIIALVDCYKAEATRGPKWMWALIILLINLIGPILYFVIGRRND